MSNFINYIEEAGHRMGRSRAFIDFLTMAVCCLSFQEQEKDYFEAIKPYNKEELNAFCKAFAEIVIEIENNPLSDCLGDYYIDCLGSKRKGQVLTPPSVCDLIAQLNIVKPFSAVNDPCCGSGRLFLSTAKLDKHNIYCGADVDFQCCQMTLINLCLNGLFGFVSHMDTLSLEEWHRWEVIPHPEHKFPYIHKLTLHSERSSLYDKTVEQIVQTPPKDVVIQEENPIIKKPQITSLLTQLDSLL